MATQSIPRLAEIAGHIDQIADDDTLGDALREIADELRALAQSPVVTEPDDGRLERIFELAADTYAKDGELEFDAPSWDDVSDGDENGAYVKAWVWVDFAGTDLDKGDDE